MADFGGYRRYLGVKKLSSPVTGYPNQPAAPVELVMTLNPNMSVPAFDSIFNTYF